MKEKIKAELCTKINELAKQKTKLRYLKDFAQKPYVSDLNLTDFTTILKLRLNMTQVKCNYKKHFIENLLCELCKEKLDTTEHLFECKEIKIPKKLQKIRIDRENPNKTLAKHIQKTLEHRKIKGCGIDVCKGSMEQEPE